MPISASAPSTRALPAALLAALCLLCPATSASARAGDVVASDAPLPFEKARLPQFRNGRLTNEVLADRADANLADPELPVVNMSGVTIYLYDAKAALNPGQPPPVVMKVTSLKGSYRRQSPGPGRPPEEIAHLDGDVVATRYENGREITRIECDYARWNHSRHFLVGEGKVKFTQGDNTIEGSDFYYNPERETPERLGSDPDAFRNWGGIATINNNVLMTIATRPPGSDPDRGETLTTTVRCRGVASYDLDEGRVQFEQDVRVDRPGLSLATGPGPNGVLLVELGPDARALGFTALHEVRIKSAPKPGGAPADVFEAYGDRARLDLVKAYLHLTRFDHADVAGDRRQRGPLPSATLTRVDGSADRLSDEEIIFVLDNLDPARHGADPLAAVAGGLADPAGGAPGTPGAGALRELRTTGGLGTAHLTVGGQPAALRYKGTLHYHVAEGRARIEQVEELASGDPETDGLRLSADAVDIVRTVPDKPPEVSAEGSVRLTRGTWIAGAHGIQFDPARDLLQLRSRMEGGQAIPPYPWIENSRRGARFEAPRLDLFRQVRPDGTASSILQGLASLDGLHGRCRALIRTAAEAGVDEGDRRGVEVIADGGMAFIEAERRANFIGVNAPVTAESADPEDEFVLDCAFLRIEIEPEPVEAVPGTGQPVPAKPAAPSVASGLIGDGIDAPRMRLKSLSASGDAKGRWPATLRRGAWECKGALILQTIEDNRQCVEVRNQSNETGVPAYPARIEGEGMTFAADRFAAYDRGAIILALGKGRFEIPDRSEKLVISFAERGEYRAPMDKDPLARVFFLRDVRLVGKAWSTQLNCDVLNISLKQPELAGGTDPLSALNRAAPAELFRHPDVAEALGRQENGRFPDPEGGVVITHVTAKDKVIREARGDQAVVRFKAFGAEYLLNANTRQDPARRVRVRDVRLDPSGQMLVHTREDFSLVAPYIQADQAANAFTAPGPGELVIPGALTDGRRTTATYRTSFEYREAAEEMTMRGAVNVNIGGEWLGSGELLRLKTRVDLDDVARDQRQLDVMRVDLYGMQAYGVVSGFAEFQMYPPPSATRADLPLDRRVGQSLKARAAELTFDVMRKQIAIKGRVRDHRPQIVFQQINADAAGNPTSTTRTRGVFPDNAEFNIDQTTQIRNQFRNAEITTTVPIDGPLAFDDEK